MRDIPKPKRIVPHEADCMFADTDTPDEFYVQGADFQRDAIGRKGGTWTWESYLCNDPDCPGTVIVRFDYLAQCIARDLRAAGGGRP